MNSQSRQPEFDQVTIVGKKYNKYFEEEATKFGKKQSKMRFSEDHKASCLQVLEDGKSVRRMQGSGSYPIVLCSQPLTETNPAVSFTIVEEPGNHGIWMGICIHDIVKAYNYASCYGIGKGTYAIDQVGVNHASAYSWSHHDPAYNSQPKVGWTFKLGEIVTVRLNFSENSVTFEKGENSYTQPILTTQGQIYAFVGPSNLGDTLAIVD